MTINNTNITSMENQIMYKIRPANATIYINKVNKAIFLFYILST